MYYFVDEYPGAEEGINMWMCIERYLVKRKAVYEYNNMIYNGQIARIRKSENKHCSIQDGEVLIHNKLYFNNGKPSDIRGKV